MEVLAPSGTGRGSTGGPVYRPPAEAAFPHRPQRLLTRVHRRGTDPSTRDFDGICGVMRPHLPTARNAPNPPATFPPPPPGAAPPRNLRGRPPRQVPQLAPKEPHSAAVTPDPAPIWTRLQAELRRRVPDATFDTWLAPLEFGGVEDGDRVVVLAGAD